MGRVAQSIYRLATGWTVRWSNPGGSEIFRTCPNRPWGPPSLLYIGYLVFSGSKEWPGRDADPSPPSSAVVKKDYSYTSTPPMGRTAWTGPQCLYSTAIPLLPSVPVQYSYTSTPPMDRTACTEPQCLYSTAIPLLPLRAVQPVQSLSACTVELYLYSPYGPYGLYRASVPVQ